MRRRYQIGAPRDAPGWNVAEYRQGLWGNLADERARMERPCGEKSAE